MSVWQGVDPTGLLIVELRDFAAAVGIAEPTTRRGLAAIALGEAIYGDEKAEDRAAPYVILRRIGPSRRLPRAPLERARYQADAYGTTPAQATTLWNLVADCFSAKGPRRRSAGVAVFLSDVELGGQATIDPDTDEPRETGFILVSVPLAQA